MSELKDKKIIREAMNHYDDIVRHNAWMIMFISEKGLNGEFGRWVQEKVKQLDGINFNLEE